MLYIYVYSYQVDFDIYYSLSIHLLTGEGLNLEYV